jgi:hypothetical protein
LDDGAQCAFDDVFAQLPAGAFKVGAHACGFSRATDAGCSRTTEAEDSSRVG